jgi:hypothetical protein
MAKKSRDEDDRREHLEGEDEAKTGVLCPGFSKDKTGACKRAGE